MGLIVERAIEANIIGNLKSGKVSVIYGARRVGKTFLMKKLHEKLNLKTYWINGELPDNQSFISSRNTALYSSVFSDYELIIIDEAQEIPLIGKALKIIVDEFPNLKVIVSGSSAFDLGNEVGEPLVGRASWYKLYPIAQLEIKNIENVLETKRKLPERLIYGCYPEVYLLESFNDKRVYLNELVNAYLLKDIIAFEGVRNSSKIMDLLKLLSFQLGKEVSMNELGKQLGMSKNTVEKYLDLLEKVFIIKKIGGFSRNLRKEISKNSRWYFWDNGVRNALINNFSELSIRQDIGELWENYLMTERLKKNEYQNGFIETYFWRTYDQQEIDCIEEKDGNIRGVEFKWGNKKGKIPGGFERAYPNAIFEVINQENYLEFLT